MNGCVGGGGTIRPTPKFARSAAAGRADEGANQSRSPIGQLSVLAAVKVVNQMRKSEAFSV